MPVRREVVRFGLFEVDLREGVLIKNGRSIKLQEQPFRILAILLEHPGQTVSREELRRALWPADTFVDFDRGLNAAMAKLRQALGDSADNPRFIETQARRGYRFIAPVNAPAETAADSGTTTPERRSGHNSRWITAAALSLLLAGASMFFYNHHRERRDASPEPLPPPIPLTSYPGFQRFPTFSPEGTRVAFAWNEPGKRPSNIYVKLIGSGDPVRLTTGDGKDFAPAWSPDGRYIAFVRSQGPRTTAVMLIPSLGGPERELSRLQLDSALFLDSEAWTVPPPLLAWSSNSKWLLAVQQAGPSNALQIIRISVESGEITPLKLFPESSSNRVHTNLFLTSGDAGMALSPDGKTLAFAHVLDVPNNSLFVINVSDDMLPTGSPRGIHFESGYYSGIAWDPDGQSLLLSSQSRGPTELWRVPVDPRRKPALLNVNDNNPGEIAVSKTAQRMMFTHYSGNLKLWRGELGNGHLKDPAPLIESTTRDARAAYSSDGRRIAFESDRSGSEELWTANADGSQPVQLTSFGSSAWAGSPTWSPTAGKLPSIATRRESGTFI